MWKKILIVTAVLAGLAGGAQAQPDPNETYTPTSTWTITSTLTPTRTANPGLTPAGKKVSGTSRLGVISQAAPGARQGDLTEILSMATRQIKIQATNAAALGRTDIGTVVSILAFATTTGAPATQTLLIEGADYTVAAGDVTSVGDHSSEVWIITYRP